MKNLLLLIILLGSIIAVGQPIHLLGQRDDIVNDWFEANPKYKFVNYDKADKSTVFIEYMYDNEPSIKLMVSHTRGYCLMMMTVIPKDLAGEYIGNLLKDKNIIDDGLNRWVNSLDGYTIQLVKLKHDNVGYIFTPR